MSKDRFNIIQEELSENHLPKEDRYTSARQARILEQQAKFERLWLIDPEQFNPLRNCLQRERLDKTWQLIQRHCSLDQAQVVDLGCAAGVFSRRLRDAGAKVEAADIAENALKRVREHDMHNIRTRQEAMPTTSLQDDAYDLVVCTELIAYLPPEDYRLFFAELSRVVKATGFVVCSTPIDINTDGAIEKLLDLAHTEFDITECVLSYHALYLRLRSMIETPHRFVRGGEDGGFRHRELAKRQGWRRWLFWLNTTIPFVWFWKMLRFLMRPLAFWFRHSQYLLLKLEKACRFLWDEGGISHLLFIAQRRPVHIPEPENPDVRRPRKKEVWE